MHKKPSQKSKFSTNLSKLRNERGLSQRQAAAELGLSQALLSHYETDAREPKFEFVLKACDYYSVTSDYILGRTNERRDGATKFSAEISEIAKELEDLKETETALINKLKAIVE